MKPLLRKEDRELLEREDIYVGCYTGVKLPVHEPPKDADEWLNNASKILIQQGNKTSLLLTVNRQNKQFFKHFEIYKTFLCVKIPLKTGHRR